MQSVKHETLLLSLGCSSVLLASFAYALCVYVIIKICLQHNTHSIFHPNSRQQCERPDGHPTFFLGCGDWSCEGKTLHRRWWLLYKNKYIYLLTRGNIIPNICAHKIKQTKETYRPYSKAFKKSPAPGYLLVHWGLIAGTYSTQARPLNMHSDSAFS